MAVLSAAPALAIAVEAAASVVAVVSAADVIAVAAEVAASLIVVVSAAAAVAILIDAAAKLAAPPAAGTHILRIRGENICHGLAARLTCSAAVNARAHISAM